MADIDYSDADFAADRQVSGPSRFGVVANWVGAVTSLGLVIGMAVWAWQLTVRDVSGVPVIRALEGPMRVAPADPGGTQAEHQGLSVNRIAEGEEASPAADRIVLAPPPVELGEVTLRSASAETPAPAAPPADPTPEAASEATMALIDRLIGEEETDTPAPSEATSGVIDASVPGVRLSPRPVLRPADRPVPVSAPQSGTEAEDETATTAAADPLNDEIAPESLAEGTRLVQLGAFDDAETARAEWGRLVAAYPDFFDGKTRVVQAAVSGGRQFYRLRAHGFADLSDSRRFCTALLAQGAACIPVTVR